LNVPESGKKSNRGAAHGCALVANGIDNVHRTIDLLSASLLTRFLGRADFSSQNARVIRTSDRAGLADQWGAKQATPAGGSGRGLSIGVFGNASTRQA
jgi:hypothetical protein